MKENISIIGGDLRLIKLAQMLENEGRKVYTYGVDKFEIEYGIRCNSLEEAINASDIIVAPIPLSSNKVTINAPFSGSEIAISSLIEKMDNKIFIAGAIRQEIYKEFENKNVKIVDILKREELSVLNAISTAEGAIKIAIEETETTIHGSNVLILGFGRIGKVLANNLQGMKANVVCEARKNSDLAWIKAYGYKPLPLENLNEHLNEFDIIINTIPFTVLDKSNLYKVSKDALIIDLASNPGGVDRQEVKKQNIKFVWALSLPGKVAPVTSAKIIKETLENVIKEI